MSSKNYTVIESWYPVQVKREGVRTWIESGVEIGCYEIETNLKQDALNKWQSMIRNVEHESGKCTSVSIVDNDTGNTIEYYSTEDAYLMGYEVWEGQSLYSVAYEHGSSILTEWMATMDELIGALVQAETHDFGPDFIAFCVDTVLDDLGRAVDWDAAVWAMDDDLREEIAASGDYDHDNQGFFERYAELHRERFDEDWAPFVGGAW